MRIGILFFLFVALTSSGCEKSEKEKLTSTELAQYFRAEAMNHLIEDDDVDLVAEHCTACHSALLVTQNRATEEGWLSTIQWMQEKQNLWDLGKDESRIIAYLARNYSPEETGRRLNLKEVEWYILEQ